MDLSSIRKERRRWVELSGLAAGVEVEIRHVSPKDHERFREKMIREGILKKGEGSQIAAGRFGDFCREFARAYVTAWRGDIKLGDQENAEYSPELMGTVFEASAAALTAVTEAARDEAAFFSESGSASPD